MLRAPPLLSILGYVGFALGMVRAYGEDAIFAPTCYYIPFGVECPPARTLWLFLAALWTTAAVVLAALMELGFMRSRDGRGTGIPGPALLAFGLVVTALGVFWAWSFNEGGYGRVSQGVESALFFTYVTCALFLFGIVFLNGTPRRRPGRGWTIGLAAANELVSLVLGYMMVDAILNPPAFA